MKEKYNVINASEFRSILAFIINQCLVQLFPTHMQHVFSSLTYYPNEFNFIDNMPFNVDDNTRCDFSFGCEDHVVCFINI